MINTIILNDQIKVWWEYVKLSPEESFLLSVNGEERERTEKSHFNVKSLAPNTDYRVKVEKIDKDGKVLALIGEAKETTLQRKVKLDVTKAPYNAVGDGKTLNTKALQSAINDCKVNECVYFPNGEYLTGALDVGSNVELYLEDNAVIKGSTAPEDYLPKITSRFEGNEMLCYRSLINVGRLDSKGGINCENITVRGGKIIGGGQELRKNIIETERVRVLKENGLEKEINPAFYYSTILPGRTRGRLISCNNVKNVKIIDCETGNSPAWNLHFVYCEDIITCGGRIVSHAISNGDGWNPDSSKNCVIFDTVFDTGDDCVAIKSGKNMEGFLVGRPSEGIRVFDTRSIDGHGIAIGSEMSGGVKDVKIWNCDIATGTGITIKTAEKRGGYIKDVTISNCKVPIVQVTAKYGLNDDGDSAPNAPEVSDLRFEDITVTGVGKFTGENDRVEPETAFQIKGQDKEHPIKRVKVKNLTLKYRQMLPNQWISLNDVEDVEIEDIICLGEI